MAKSRTFQRPGRNKPFGPDPIDVQVGSRVRLRRNMLGFSQERLGDALGLTFQQVQKYERGANRVSASRLYQLSRVLDVPVRFFYDEVDPVRAPALPGGFAEPPAASYEADPLRNPETLELIEAFFAIPDAAVRQRLFHLAKALAAEAAALDDTVAPQRRRRRQHHT
jgi:transcriptional regulator with XRE-family HTH domain